ncbi:MAG: hypothetical protein KAT34_06710 [Candidatus Aminicenantes bacterium]|jgi:hypothetical protein|nr:hypothetical protein [Candidatus Aminicenantes bacterium]
MKSKKRIFTSSIVGFFLLIVFLLFPGQKQELKETPGELSRVHGELAGRDHCGKCHSAAKEIEPGNCLNCHEELSRRIKAETGFHRDKQENCGVCHPEHNGKNHRLIQWDPADFDHSETGYYLSGAHQRITSCDHCHHGKNSPLRKYTKSFFLKDNRCSACHKDAHRGNQPVCTDCHTTKDWSVDIW